MYNNNECIYTHPEILPFRMVYLSWPPVVQIQMNQCTDSQSKVSWHHFLCVSSPCSQCSGDWKLLTFHFNTTPPPPLAVKCQSNSSAVAAGRRRRLEERQPRLHSHRRFCGGWMSVSPPSQLTVIRLWLSMFQFMTRQDAGRAACDPEPPTSCT